MKSLYQLRKDLGLKQKTLSEMSGISQDHLSLIENGKYKPTEKTRQKIEKVTGKVDWIETGFIRLHDANWFEAERLLKRLVEMTLNLDVRERKNFNKLITKYFGGQ